ncbi:MAG: cellulase family glycosylhydrolase [Deltaproteobacteria bacterium]|nr:cellulase family glycosylhydrolase [Deltaproteobacteria bacterium]
MTSSRAWAPALAWIALACHACAGAVGGAPRREPAPGFIEIDGDGFRDAATGRPWVPVGANYDHDARGRLIEDYWHEEWARVEGDFEEMARLGFTVVRVHLQLGRFMKDATTLDERELERLDRLVTLSARLDLRLDLTGLASYRKHDIPAWFLALDDERMAAAEAAFWRGIAARYAGEPAVYCYDLQNEPIVSLADTSEIVGPPLVGVEGTYHFINLKGRDVSRAWTRWVRDRYGAEGALAAAWSGYPRPGETFDRIALPGLLDRLRNEDLVRFGHDRAADWTRRMVSAIRESDRRHLVTIGLLPDSLPFGEIYSSFAPAVLADLLDFVSVHLHVREEGGRDNALESEMVARAAYVGKPVVVEELSMLVAPKKRRGASSNAPARARPGSWATTGATRPRSCGPGGPCATASPRTRSR